MKSVLAFVQTAHGRILHFVVAKTRWHRQPLHADATLSLMSREVQRKENKSLSTVNAMNRTTRHESEFNSFNQTGIVRNWNKLDG